MKIKLFPGEYLFGEQGTHVCDDRGIAIKVDSIVEIEVSESRADHVISLLSAERHNRGLDSNGEPISESRESESLEIPAEELPSSQSSPEEEIIVIPPEDDTAESASSSA